MDAPALKQQIEALSSPALPLPRFLYAPVVRVGDFYRTSGMIALNPGSGVLEPGGPGAECSRILANLLSALPDFGLSLGDLLSATIYTTRFDAFGEINAAWDAVFRGQARLPARTSLGVIALPLEASVEMEFEFYRVSPS